MQATAKTRQAVPELDEVTFRRARDGDPGACRALFERYQRPLHDMLWRMVEHTAGAAAVEDLTQETFLRVFGALARFRYDGPARLSTWILTIGTRLALNELRPRPLPTVPLLDQELVPGPHRADEVTRRRLLGQAIRRALANLSPQLRAVLVLREYHGLSYEDMARACDVDTGTVKSRLSRARAAMRRALHEVRNG